MSQLRDGRPETAAQVLSQLVAPAREAGGAEAGEVMARAPRGPRRLVTSVTRRDHDPVEPLSGWSRGSTRRPRGSPDPKACRAAIPRSTGCSAAASGGRT